MKRNNNKGFTLAELLIVVAVIAVLVAVAIPTFTGQLEKSRQAVDVSNLRGAYAAARLAEIDQAVGNETFKELIKAFDADTAGYTLGLQWWYDPDSGNLKRVVDTSNDTAAEAKLVVGKATTAKVVADTSQLPFVDSKIYYTDSALSNDSVGSVEKGILVTFATDNDTNGRYVIDKITFVTQAGTFNKDATTKEYAAKGISGFIDTVLYTVLPTSGEFKAGQDSAVTGTVETTTLAGTQLKNGVEPYKFNDNAVMTTTATGNVPTVAKTNDTTLTVTVPVTALEGTFTFEVPVTDANKNVGKLQFKVVVAAA